ncbi:hypothetical protein ILUMI_22251 [Ignelater luminosus]|uniref:Uncharacterized protein n=1 Tax=Ignelater luminosus TaxID=2038154 RepID=A0A8K0CE68_IGNLU|nr:hypothetical protein ILUMI_22251 [Ignelater luminosus]
MTHRKAMISKLDLKSMLGLNRFMIFSERSGPGCLDGSVFPNDSVGALDAVRIKQIKERDQQVTAKVADFDIRGAVKLLSSNDTLADTDENTYFDLKKKHPSPSRLLSFPSPPSENHDCLTVCSSDVQKAINSFPSCSASEIARLKALQLPESGAWLQAIPSSHIGTLMDNNSFRVCVALRIGSPVCRPYNCICGAQVSVDGRHGLHCGKGSGRFLRHNELNDILKQAEIVQESNQNQKRFKSSDNRTTKRRKGDSEPKESSSNEDYSTHNTESSVGPLSFSEEENDKN